MRAKLILPLFAGLVLAAAPSVRAQSATAAAPAPDHWSARPIGTYELVADANGEPHPVTLTISDSAGTTTAKILGDDGSHPMTVTVKDTDLVLASDTPRGPMTLTLQRRGNELTGTWSRLDKGGALTGKVKP